MFLTLITADDKNQLIVSQQHSKSFAVNISAAASRAWLKQLFPWNTGLNVETAALIEELDNIGVHKEVMEKSCTMICFI